jgi:hypothetical protein
MFEDLIHKLKQRAPPKKEGGGFFSGAVNSIEYGNSINVNKLKKDLNLKESDFELGYEVAGLNGDYVFAMDREYLYCRSGHTYAMHPPSDNVHEFEVSRTSTSAALGTIQQQWEIYAIPLRKIERGVKLTRSGVAETGMGGMRFDYSRLSLTLVGGKSIEFNVNSFSDVHFHFLDILFQEIQETLVKDELLKQAERHEKLLEFDQAADIYKKYGMDDDVIRLREKSKVKQTIVHGDYIDDRDTTYVDDRDTIVKDSVVSKSNVGASGKSKGEQIKVIKDLLDSGAIDDDEFKQMKQEILGK